MHRLSLILATALATALAIAPVAAIAGPVPAKLTSVTPVNAEAAAAPILQIVATFSGPVALKSLRVTGPRGENSLEQVLVEYGAKMPVASAYAIPVKVPVTKVGRYSIELMKWEPETKTSSSISTSFQVGTAAELEDYDEALARFDQAEHTLRADEEANESQVGSSANQSARLADPALPQ